MRLLHRLSLGISLALLLGACACPTPAMPTPALPTPALPASASTLAPSATEPTALPIDQLIAFINTDEHVCLIEPHERSETCLTTNGRGFSPVWSPDGRKLAYTYWKDASPASAAVMIYDLDSQNASPLTLDINAEWLYIAISAWSSDGRYLIIENGTSMSRDVYVVNASSGEILHTLSTVGYTHLSPDGKRLVVGIRQPLEKEHPDVIQGLVSLAVLEIGQQEPRVILESTYESSYFPQAWLPDGRVLYHRFNWEGGTFTQDPTQWTINPDGGEPQPARDIPLAFDIDALKELLPSRFQTSSAWSFSTSADGRQMVFRWGNQLESGVYLFDLGAGGEPELLAHGYAPAWQPQPAE